VTKVDHRVIGNGKMGPVTTQLRKMFDDIARGKNPKYVHWNTAV
jgi:branched-chain amino acid aminotransferase